MSEGVPRTFCGVNCCVLDQPLMMYMVVPERFGHGPIVFASRASLILVGGRLASSIQSELIAEVMFPLRVLAIVVPQ